ncbi:unnamed protein product, partial [Phaeothamnion confervicola]
AAQIGELFTAFSLYHKRGVKNRLQQIRAPRRWTSADPAFNVLSSGNLQITRADHGKEFEFAESKMTVTLPVLAAADRGFEVVIAYTLNEARPAPSNEVEAQERIQRAVDERERYAAYLEVLAGDAATFSDGGRSTTVAARRSKRIIWDGATWHALDRNELDFHATLSALSAYPSLMRRLGWVFDLEFPVADVFPDFRAGMFSGRIRVTPAFAAHVSDLPGVGAPWTLFSVGDHSGTTPQGIPLTSFSASPDPRRPGEPIAAGFRDLSKAG